MARWLGMSILPNSYNWTTGHCRLGPGYYLHDSTNQYQKTRVPKPLACNMHESIQGAYVALPSNLVWEISPVKKKEKRWNQWNMKWVCQLLAEYIAYRQFRHQFRPRTCATPRFYPSCWLWSIRCLGPGGNKRFPQGVLGDNAGVGWRDR